MSEYKTFDFPHHFATHSYPAGDQVQFGRGWSHASEPDRPLQRTFLLKFKAMLFVKNPHTGEWLRGADAQPGLEEMKRRSIWCLDDFYDEHLMHKKFLYNHYVFGEMVVRFAQPFQMPDPLESNRNIYDEIPTNSFEVRLIEQPE